MDIEVLNEVRISVEEYRELIEKKAKLECVMNALSSEKFICKDDICSFLGE